MLSGHLNYGLDFLTGGSSNTSYEMSTSKSVVRFQHFCF